MLFNTGTKKCPACGSDKITSFPDLEIKCCHKCGYWFSWTYQPPGRFEQMRLMMKSTKIPKQRSNDE